MAHNEIELISLADAHFGIFGDRDSKIIEHAVATKYNLDFLNYVILLGLRILKQRLLKLLSL